MPSAPWPFLSEAEAIAAAGILSTVALAMLAYVGRRRHQEGQRRSLISHLGLEIVSNHNRLKLQIGYPIARSAWSDHRVRGLFGTDDGIQIETAYMFGDAYNTHIQRRTTATGEQMGAEDRAIRESAVTAEAAFEKAGKVLEKYGWPF